VGRDLFTVGKHDIGEKTLVTLDQTTFEQGFLKTHWGPSLNGKGVP
jgi:hypothetical protein